MNIGYLIFVVFSLLLTFFLKPDRSSIFDPDLNLILTMIAFFNIAIFWRYIITKFSWINFGTLFTLGFIIVHFQIPFLASLGIEPEKPNLIWPNKWVVNYATWLSLVSLLLWIFGYLINKRDIKFVEKNQNKEVDLKKINVLLIFIFISFLLLVGNEFLSGNYNGGSNWGTGSMYVFVVLRVILCLKIFYFFYNDKVINRKSIIKNKYFFSIIIIYALVFLNAGDRGPLIELIIVAVTCYTIFHRRIFFVTFAIGFIASAFFLNMVKFGRTSNIAYREGNIIESGYNNFLQQESFNPTNELASSNRILYLSLDKVPDNYPYLNGLTFFHEVISCVPFTMFLYVKFTQMPEFYFSTSRFFTVIRQGKYYESGDGSEIIADIYVNFGVYGVFILMMFFGYFISFVQFNALTLFNHKYLIIYVFLLISALYINRSSFLDPLKTVIYALLIDYLFIKKR